MPHKNFDAPIEPISPARDFSRCVCPEDVTESTCWGWFYLSTVLDDFSRYIPAWKLCTTMSAADVSDTLQLALKASGLDRVKVLHRPRLLSDNGPSYVSSELGDWLKDKGIRHVRGRPYHPMTQGKIERYQQIKRGPVPPILHFLHSTTPR